MIDPTSEPRSTPIADGALPNPDEAPLADDLVLKPPECPSSDEFLRDAFPVDLPEPDAPPPAPRLQFSLVELMVITLGVAVGMAGGTWMPPSTFAGVMSILAMVGLLAVHFFPPESRGGWLVWVTVFLAYFVAVLVAVTKPGTA